MKLILKHWWRVVAILAQFVLVWFWASPAMLDAKSDGMYFTGWAIRIVSLYACFLFGKPVYKDLKKTFKEYT